MKTSFKMKTSPKMKTNPPPGKEDITKKKGSRIVLKTLQIVEGG